MIDLLDARSRYERDCVVWTGPVNTGGYGQLKVDGRKVLAHRIACELEHGPPPPGKPLALHRCGNRRCIRGDHLYWGDRSDNTRDSVADGTHNMASKGACKRGHEFTPENTRVVEGRWRVCRTCDRERKAPGPR